MTFDDLESKSQLLLISKVRVLGCGVPVGFFAGFSFEFQFYPLSAGNRKDSRKDEREDEDEDKENEIASDEEQDDDESDASEDF